MKMQKRSHKGPFGLAELILSLLLNILVILLLEMYLFYVYVEKEIKHLLQKIKHLISRDNI